ncbi:MAG: hypothetical protein GY720_08420 [bacterium]|nr:hypothetical protein [bacterium]
MDLEWRATNFGLECDGYRIVRGGTDAKPWRLVSTRVVFPGRSGRYQHGTDHPSVEDAKRWAESAVRDDIRRITAAGHFSLSAVAFASFVGLSQFIGSLSGLLVVAGTLYVALRSFGNGIGALLNDAWGWTRLGRPRSSLLERIVSAIVRRARRRRAEVLLARPLRSVRELVPPQQ